jgi:3-hexulose-6-phosphate synthase
MKLQVAFDITDLEKALSIAHTVEPYADIIEIGTLLIYAHGIHAIKTFKHTFPHATILADAKIIDRSKDAVALFAEAGADWITVMAGASSTIIQTACSTAQSYGKKIMLDLADSSSLGQSALDSKSLGVDALMFHKPTTEAPGVQFIDRWDLVQGNTTLPIFISASITRETIGDILTFNPYGIVIGSTIVAGANPEQEAAYFAQLLGNR